MAVIAISGHRDLGWPREPGAFTAGPIAPPAPSPELFPGQSRVFLAQPADHSPPQVVAEIREAALTRVMTVVVGPTPQDWVERVDQLIEREVRRAAVSMAICFSPTTARKFPAGGHRFSPLVAIKSPHEGVGRGQVRGFTPLPAVAWASL